MDEILHKLWAQDARQVVRREDMVEASARRQATEAADALYVQGSPSGQPATPKQPMSPTAQALAHRKWAEAASWQGVATGPSPITTVAPDE